MEKVFMNKATAMYILGFEQWEEHKFDYLLFTLGYKEKVENYSTVIAKCYDALYGKYCKAYQKANNK